MLSGHDIVYFGNDWHADNRTSSHHVADILRRTNRVLYVEVSGARAPRAAARDLRRVATKLVKLFQRPREVSDRFYVQSLLLVPFRRWPLVAALNRVLALGTIRRSMRILGMKAPISWILTPEAGFVAGHLGEKLVVHFCHDDYANMPRVDYDSMWRLHRQLIDRADVLIAVSQSLAERIAVDGKPILVSPHGVDVRHFGLAMSPDTPIPSDAAHLRRPIVIFIGLVEEWVDTGLLAHIARSRPDWTLLIVGRVAVSDRSWMELPNVHCLGPRPYAELPGYLKAAQVAIMPYHINQQTLHSNPLKLREYLAAGLPVVSVPVPEVERYSPPVLLGRDPQHFVSCIQQALDQDTPEQRQARFGRVANESWEQRVERLSAFTEQILAEVEGRENIECRRA